MFRKLRKIPPVCLFLSLLRLLTGRLRLKKLFVGKSISMINDDIFTVFRHISVHPVPENPSGCTFIVKFKFRRLSHRANKIASLIPMLLITGFPGFVAKYYAVNLNNGYWQGMYQWQSMDYLAAYKESFVYRMMNKRAISGSIKVTVLENQKLKEYIEHKLINHESSRL